MAPRTRAVQGNGPNDEAPASVQTTVPTSEGGTGRPTPVGGLQENEVVSGPLTTRPPRGVGELPSNALADDDGGRAVQEAVQAQLDDEERRGYRGARRTKAVPNENYTLRGVGRGLPTPETTVHTPTAIAED